jgi:DNA-binding PadR family transcriptional regulator
VEALLEAKTLLLFELVTPSYGQQLMRRAQGRGQRLRPASVYPALRALEARGLVRSRKEHAGRGRSRRVHELTVEGVRLAMARREALAALLGLTPVPGPRRRRTDMADRLRRCAEVSAVGAMLRDAMLRARRR